MRTVLASLALALLAAGPAWAQASRPVTPTDPFPWSVEAPEAQPGKWRICLWLPTLQGYVDATGNANALFRSHQRTTFVTLYTTRAAEAEAPLDLEGAWLETPAGRLEP